MSTIEYILWLAALPVAYVALVEIIDRLGRR
jgi:hypothetical protein